MKKIFLLVFAAATLLVVSCKKDKDNNGTTPPPSAKTLIKMTKQEGTVTTVYNFTYDGAKRLTSFKSADNKAGASFSYDANGNLVKVEENEDDYKNIYTYSYTNNKPVSGTFKSWQKTAGEPDDLIEDDQLTYTLTNNQVTKIHVMFTLSQDAADFNLTYGGNGNLSSIVGAGNNYTASFTYGNKKPVFPIVSPYVLDQSGFSLQFVAKNELLSIVFDFPGTQFDETLNNQYTYDQDGYVLTSTDGSSSVTYQYQ